MGKIILHNREMNSLRTIKRRTANWMGHVRGRNCLLKHVTERKIVGWIEMRGRRGRRRKGLLYGIKEKRGYWKLKKEALDRCVWKSRFGPVVRQETE